MVTRYSCPLLSVVQGAKGMHKSALERNKGRLELLDPLLKDSFILSENGRESEFLIFVAVQCGKVMF